MENINSMGEVMVGIAIVIDRRKFTNEVVELFYVPSKKSFE